MTRKYILKGCLILVLLCGWGCSLPAQQDWSWVFGDSVLMRFPGGGAPVVDPVFRTRYSLESSSCISDGNGNLKYYAMQDWVYRRNGLVMPGGFQLTASDLTNGYLMLPVWGDTTDCLFFSLAFGCGLPTLCPWVEEIKGPMGSETIINVRNLGQYHPTHSLSEKVAAARDASGTGWWVIMHGEEDNSFVKFKVDGNQVSALTTQAIGSVHGTVGANPYARLGEVCFSPQGDKLLAVTATGIVDVFDFDRCSGQLSNWVALGTPAPNFPGPNTFYGGSFSQDGTKIYASESASNTLRNNLYQWDLSAPNVPASIMLISTAPDSVEFGQHQLGPDGKIYVAKLFTIPERPDSNSYYLSVINNPNVAGLACNFVYQQVYLEGQKSTYNLPNLPNFDLPPLVAQVAEAGPPQVLICAGDSFLIGYPDSTGGAVSFAWDAHPDIADTTQPQVWVHPSQSTWYFVTAVDSGFGLPCGKTIDSIHVVIADSSLFPVAFAGNDTTICPGDSVVLGAGGGQPGWTYFWAPGGQTSATITVTQPGVYRVFVTNPAGIGDCFTVGDLVVVDTFPGAELAELAGLDQILCLGDSVRIGSGTGLGFGYAWSMGVLPADTIPAWVADTGTFVLSIFNPDSLGGCFLGTDTVLVVPFDSLLLPPGFAGMDTTICLGDSVLLGIALPSQWLGSWTPRNGSLLFPDSLSTLAWPSGTTTFILAATDTSNHGACATLRDTVLITVEVPFVHPRPEAQEFCPGEILQIGVPSVGAFSYVWSPVFGLNDPFVSLTTVAPMEAIVYTLAVSSDTMVSENCKTQYFPVALTSDGCITQNVVTPNGDGINDFLVLGSFNGPVSVSVYDRWGGLVFSTNAYTNDWPQTGSQLPETVYWYVAKVASEGGKAYVGEIMVLR